MPYAFCSKTRKAKCKGCSDKIEANSAHLSTAAKKNYHIKCIPDGEKIAAYRQICPQTINTFAAPVRARMRAALQKGKALYDRRRVANQKLRATVREIQRKQLHESCAKNDKCIIGYTQKNGAVLTTVARFGYMVEATPG